MLFDKSARLSARVFGFALNYPLYDADCCPAARELLAVGNVAGAIAEWRRLADLGSGSARCVLAYLHLLGAPSVPADLEEAKRIAQSAVSGARGYANYLLACIAIREKHSTEAGKYLVQSVKAGFLPAITLLASLSVIGGSAEAKQKAVGMLRKSAADGHLPALLRLIGIYLSGELGWIKKITGMVLLIPAFIRLWLAIKYQGFSIHCFQVPPAASKRNLFAEEIKQGLPQADLAARDGRRNLVRYAHVAAAITAAIVLARSRSYIRAGGGESIWAMAGWVLLAFWPYGISYLIASTTNTRSSVSTLIQTTSLCVVTMLACGGYLGELFDPAPSVWGVILITVVQAFWLLAGCGLGENAALQVEAGGAPISVVQHRIIWTHGILALIAAGSWLLRSTVWHLDYWKEHGFLLVSLVLLATLPYVTSAALAYRLVTPSRWKPWAFVCILILGTALAVVNNSGIWMLQPGILGVGLVLIVQFIAYVVAAEWALDETEW